jgi:hypothetical protein
VVSESFFRFSQCLLGWLLVAVVAQAQEPMSHLWVADVDVGSIVVVGDTVYLGGGFEYLGPPTGQFARLDVQTGEADLSGAKIGGTVHAVAPDGHGGYFVGGEFWYAGERGHFNLARILPDGSLDEGFRPDPLATQHWRLGHVEALVVEGGVLYAGGHFDAVAGETRRNLAAFDAATGELLPQSVVIEGAVDDPARVMSLAVRDGVVYAAGTFLTVGSEPRTGVAAVTADAFGVLPWDAQADHFVSRMALGDSALYLTGGFQAVGGELRRRYAEVSLAAPGGTGGVLKPWSPAGSGPNAMLRSQARQLVVSGQYVYAVGTLGPQGDPKGFVRIGRQSGVAEPMPGHPVGRLSLGNAMLIDGESAYLAGQRRRAVDQIQELAVIRIDLATGTYDTPDEPFDVLSSPRAPDLGGLKSVNVLYLSGNSLLAGGSFTSIGGVARRHLGALDLTTGRATDFAPLIASGVDRMTASPDGQYLYFQTFNGVGAADLTTGEVWTYLSAARLTEDGIEGYDGTEGIERAETERDGEIERKYDGIERVDGRIRLPGPLFLDGERPYVPEEHLVRASSRSASGGYDRPRVWGGTSYMLATDDRLFLAGVTAYDRLAATPVWQTPVVRFQSLTSGRMLVTGAAGVGAAGDTLFASGRITQAGNVARHGLAALDAETGAVLDWYPGPIEVNGAFGGIDVVGSRLYAAGSIIVHVNGEPREDLAAFDLGTAALLDWTPSISGGGRPRGESLAHHAGAVYVGGSFNFANGVSNGQGAAFHRETGELLEWHHPVGGPVLVIVPSPRHGVVFYGGNFLTSARRGGHANIVGLSFAEVDPPVSAEPGAEGGGVRLSAAWPNPAQGRVELTLSLPASGAVEVAVFDVLGRPVAVVAEGLLEAGEHTLSVDVSGWSSGVYVVRAMGQRFSESRRMTVVR